jgi:dTDP-4-dehydrorhamnose 3,5-epimerase
MKFQPLGIQGAWLIESEVFNDERGSFREWFKSDEVKSATGVDFSVAQANVSTSARGVIRGIHYSLAPDGQAKWVTCTSGRILDVIVDIRPSSPTFTKWVQVELNSENGKAVFIEANLGHAFLSLETLSTASYLLTSTYSPSDELGINPFDPEIEIKWPVPNSEMIISAKDQKSNSLSQLNSEGKLPE